MRAETDHRKSSSLLLYSRLKSAATLILDMHFLNFSFMTTPSPPQSLFECSWAIYSNATQLLSLASFY